MLKIYENFEWRALYSNEFDYESPIESNIEPTAVEGYRWRLIISAKTEYNWKLQYDNNASLEPYATGDGTCAIDYKLSLDGLTCEPRTDYQDVTPLQTQWSETQPTADIDYRWYSFESKEFFNTWGKQKLVQGTTYGQGGNWVEYNNAIPYTINEKKDESLNSVSISRLTKTKKVYRPLTRVKIVDGNKTTDWLVENCLNERVSQGLYKQTFDLIEPTESLKGYVMDNLTFTQPITPDANHPKKTLADVIKRMFSTTSKTPIDANDFVFGLPFEFFSIESPEFFFTEMTLFDGLIEIGSYVDMFPKVNIFITTGELRISFEPLDIVDKANYNVTDFIVEESQQPLSNYGEAVMSNVKNLNLSNTVVYPSNGLGLRVNSRGNTSVITDDNAVFTLPSKIQKIIKLEIRPSLGAAWADYIDYLYEKSDWMLLYPYSLQERVGDPPEKERQPHTCWYKRNTNDIEFGELFVLNPDIRGIRLRVTYIPLEDKKIRVDNVQNPQFTLINNQNENIVEGKSVDKKLNNYIKRMQYGDYVISKKYKSIDDMPVLGNLINNQYILTNLSYTKHLTHYDVTMQLSEGYTRRAEFIRAKQEIRSWEIPADGKVVDRNINHKETVYFTLGKPVEKRGQTNITQIDKLLTVLNVDIEFQGVLAVVNFETKEGTIPLMFAATIGSMGNNLLLSFSLLDNVIAGFSKATTSILDKVARQIGVTYTDNYGEFESTSIAFVSNFEDLITSDEFAINYPISTVSQNTNLMAKSYIKIDNENIEKDGREAISYNYQLSLNGINGTIVNNNLAANSLYQNHKSWTILVYFLKKKIYDKNQRIDWQFPGDIDEYVIAAETATLDVVGNQLIYTLYSGTSGLVIPTDFVAVALGYNQLYDANDRMHQLTVVQNEVTEIKNDIIQNRRITLYLDY